MKSAKQTTSLTKPFTAFGSSALMLALTTAAYGQADETDSCSNQSNPLAPCDPKVAPVSNEIELIEVWGVTGSRYLSSRSADMRRAAELADTPATLSILTQSQILDSGKSDLKEVLSGQAGVTLGTGENGNAFGDRYIIRGHEARSDVFVDGLRDPGMTTRESFATEQIEISKGPSATFAGRGTSGGAVNSVTKGALLSESFAIVDATAGSDDHSRVTLDTNVSLGTNTALRINLLEASETVANRDGITRDRRGALLAFSHSPSDRLNFAADVYSLDASDKPDLGSYFDRDARSPINDIPVYAQDEDFLDSEALSATLRAQYQLTDSTRLSGAYRTGHTENGYLATGANGTTRDQSDVIAPGLATIGLSTHQGWQEVDYSAAQFNLFHDTSLGEIDQSWVLGIDYISEQVNNGVFTIDGAAETNCVVGGRGGAKASYCLLNGNGALNSAVSTLIQRAFTRGSTDAEVTIDTTSLYAMNTLSLSENWDLFVGLRQDRFDYTNVVSVGGGPAVYDYSDKLLNGHAGLVFKLTEDANVYLTYSTASNINGGESDLGANCGYGGLCGSPDQVAQSDPESIENIELGAKLQFLDDKLLATAALFQVSKSDVHESVGDAYTDLGTLNTGENRVQGVEFSLTGSLTDKLSVQLSAAVMKSEVTTSYSASNEGLALSNFADDSLFFHLRYQPIEAFAFGASYTYKSEMYGGQPDTAAGYDEANARYSIVVPEYKTLDLFANWYISDNLNARFNIGNATNEEYWTAAYRSGSFMYIGDARTLRASLVYEF